MNLQRQWRVWRQQKSQNFTGEKHIIKTSDFIAASALLVSIITYWKGCADFRTNTDLSNKNIRLSEKQFDTANVRYLKDAIKQANEAAKQEADLNKQMSIQNGLLQEQIKTYYQNEDHFRVNALNTIANLNLQNRFTLEDLYAQIESNSLKSVFSDLLLLSFKKIRDVKYRIAFENLHDEHQSTILQFSDSVFQQIYAKLLEEMDLYDITIRAGRLDDSIRKELIHAFSDVSSLYGGLIEGPPRLLKRENRHGVMISEHYNKISNYYNELEEITTNSSVYGFEESYRYLGSLLEFLGDVQTQLLKIHRYYKEAAVQLNKQDLDELAKFFDSDSYTSAIDSINDKVFGNTRMRFPIFEERQRKELRQKTKILWEYIKEKNLILRKSNPSAKF